MHGQSNCVQLSSRIPRRRVLAHGHHLLQLRTRTRRKEREGCEHQCSCTCTRDGPRQQQAERNGRIGESADATRIVEGAAARAAVGDVRLVALQHLLAARAAWERVGGAARLNHLRAPEGAGARSELIEPLVEGDDHRVRRDWHVKPPPPARRELRAAARTRVGSAPRFVLRVTTPFRLVGRRLYTHMGEPRGLLGEREAQDPLERHRELAHLEDDPHEQPAATGLERHGVD
eukprot:5449028-Prymnesium_polylepis.1